MNEWESSYANILDQFSQAEELMSEQCVSKDENEVGFSRLLSRATGSTSSHSILLEESWIIQFC